MTNSEFSAMCKSFAETWAKDHAWAMKQQRLTKLIYWLHIGFLAYLSIFSFILGCCGELLFQLVAIVAFGTVLHFREFFPRLPVEPKESQHAEYCLQQRQYWLELASR